MKKLSYIFFACAFVCISSQAETEMSTVEKETTILNAVADVCKDIEIYREAGHSPMDGNLPLLKRISSLSIQMNNLSEIEKIKLSLPILNMVTKTRDTCVESWNTHNQVKNCCTALETIFCPLAGQESHACKEFCRNNKEKVNKIWLGALIRS